MRLSAALSSTAAKVCASVVLVGGAASVAGLGTYGSFTSTTTASESVTAGKVVLSAAQPDVLGLSVRATGLVPGDIVQRSVTLTRGNDSEQFGAITMTTTAASNNLLASDATNGLQLTVDQCSVAWAKSGSTNELTCSGDTTPLLTSRAVIGSDMALASGLTKVLNDASTANLRVQVKLPESAGNPFQGLSNTIALTFTATQRAADYR